MPGLFDPLPLQSLTLANRAVMSPMCQYSAVDGTANDWHLAHYGRFAIAGLGLMFTEATHVSARGRITPGCLGLYSDENEAALARVLAFARLHGKTPFGIQIAHAGRKASSHVPWEGGKPLGPDEGAWTTLAPSALPQVEGGPVPEEMDQTAMAVVRDEFVATAKRAMRLGFDTAELHGAHGYLLHEFLSPVSNRREDGYGGDREKRMRYPLEVFAAVRNAWPRDKPLGMRISATDYLGSEGFEVEDAIAFVKELKGLGCDFVDVSGGGVAPMRQKIALGPGYQVPYAQAIRKETGIVTMTVGMITEVRQADDILRDEKADLVAMARALLRDPHWLARAAKELGGSVEAPPQYRRAWE